MTTSTATRVLNVGGVMFSIGLLCLIGVAANASEGLLMSAIVLIFVGLILMIASAQSQR